MHTFQMAGSSHQLVHRTPTAQVHVAKTFSQELATTFTTDIIQSLVRDDTSTRIGSPIIFSLLAHVRCSDSLVKISTDAGTLTKYSPIFTSRSIQRSIEQITCFHIIQQSLSRTETYSCRITTAIGIILTVE